MCVDLFLEEATCASILVSDYLPQATTQSVRLYLITLSLEKKKKKNYWFGIMSGEVLNFESKNQ